jgi:hypothetical protein
MLENAGFPILMVKDPKFKTHFFLELIIISQLNTIKAFWLFLLSYRTGSTSPAKCWTGPIEETGDPGFFIKNSLTQAQVPRMS